VSVRADALANVDHEWCRARDIHKRSGMWSARSFRDALDLLSVDGTLEQRTIPCPQGRRMHEYRLPQKVTA
jgi:hypothetical protein